jgi:hypothetical protein
MHDKEWIDAIQALHGVNSLQFNAVMAWEKMTKQRGASIRAKLDHY